MSEKKESVSFLEHDFDQCFEQMRHYDQQIVDVCKFAFVAYSGVGALGLGVYKFGVEKQINLVLPASMIIGAGLVLGFLLFAIVVRNRGYFVRVARYINEIRGFFLEHGRADFQNRGGMYTDWRKPDFCDLWSSQLWVSYVIASLNGFLLGVFVYMHVIFTGRCNILVILSCSACLFVLQILLGILYLRNLDTKGR